ncbi:hypothetical protein [Demequina sp. NBRC 110051]|uniref:hypothetical protein n=1 Tax=Demequina sp. NBRC 110051 TaxID=1570340 RepID=UPI0009FD43CE|nr:hypothetical protein [Demequina sp. NBRC 110051]
MSLKDHEGTDALTHLAQEVEEERRVKGRTAFDAQDESEDRPTGETRAEVNEEVGDTDVDPGGEKLPPVQAFGH